MKQLSEQYFKDSERWHCCRRLGMTSQPFYTGKGHDCDLLFIDPYNILNFQLWACKSFNDLRQGDFNGRLKMVHVATFNYEHEIEQFLKLTNPDES